MKTLFTRISKIFSDQESEVPVSPPDADQKLRDGSGDGTSPADSGPEASLEQVVRELREHLAARSRRRLSPEQIDPHADAWDVGYLDSLSYVEFLAFIEKQYEVVIPDVLLTGRLKSVHAIADFICSKTGPA